MADSDQIQVHGASNLPAAPCRYCGAPLDPFYYFCRSCATPYKPVAAITGYVQPAPISNSERIEKIAPHTWTMFWVFAVVVIVSALISAPFINKENSGIFYFISTLAVFLTSAVFATIHWRPIAAQLRTPGFFKWEAWAGLAALVPLLCLNFAYNSFLHAIHVPMEPMGELPLSIGVVVFCIFPAISEEIAFRGLLQYWLEIAITPAKAIVLGSAMFAALHFSIVSFPYLFLVGVLLAVVRRRTGSLYPGMLIHFCHNLVVIMLFRF